VSGPWGPADKWPLSWREMYDHERWLTTREVECPGCGVNVGEPCLEDGWEVANHSVRFLKARAKYRLLRLQETEQEMLDRICIGCGRSFQTLEALDRHEEGCL
jgi:DNA-directed RNA polymerase subunit RPC12/RpoP